MLDSSDSQCLSSLVVVDGPSSLAVSGGGGRCGSGEGSESGLPCGEGSGSGGGAGLNERKSPVGLGRSEAPGVSRSLVLGDGDEDLLLACNDDSQVRFLPSSLTRQPLPPCVSLPLSTSLFLSFSCVWVFCSVVRRIGGGGIKHTVPAPGLLTISPSFPHP